LQARNPGQFAALQAPFINPQTGAPPSGAYGAPPPASSARASTVKAKSKQQLQDEARERHRIAQGNK